MSQFNVTTGTLRTKLQELQKDCKQLETKKQELETEEKALSGKWNRLPPGIRYHYDSDHRQDIQFGHPHHGIGPVQVPGEDGRPVLKEGGREWKPVTSSKDSKERGRSSSPTATPTWMPSDPLTH